MNPVVQQVTAWVSLAVFDVTCLVVIVAGATFGVVIVKTYRRLAEFKTDFREFLTVVSAHGAISDTNQRVLTQSVIDAMKPVPMQTAAAVIQALIKAGLRAGTADPGDVPDPPARHDLPVVDARATPTPADQSTTNAGPQQEHPTPVPTKEKTNPQPPDKPRRPPDSVRSLLVVGIVLTLAWAATIVSAPREKGGRTHADHWPREEGEEMSQVVHEKGRPDDDRNNPTGPGYDALRAGDFVKAEKAFVKEGLDVRTAEALFRQGRFDEAVLICEKHPDDPLARYFLGLIACKRGDHEKAEALLVQAKDMGSFVAGRLLAVPRWQEKV